MPQMPQPVVLVVGSLHYDIMVETDHLPRLDETAVGKRWYPKCGGKGGNQAVSAVRQGAAVRMLGAVGDDAFGVALCQNLATAGVDARFVRVMPGIGSGISVALVDGRGDYAATIVSGANLMMGAGDVAEAAVWADVGLLILQNEIPEAANIAAAVEAHRRGVRVVLNAAPYRVMGAEMRGVVDVLVVNAVEAEMMGAANIGSLGDADHAVEQLSGEFAQVIVTAGARGLAGRDADGRRWVLPAAQVKAVSSHGAGDAFIGALAAALVGGAGLEAACRAGSVAAARHVAGVA